MNIFYLHEHDQTSAQSYCDQHVCKMIVEYAQMLSTCWHVLEPQKANELFNEKKIYAKTHENHPCNKWVRMTRYNYLYLADMLYYLLLEYNYRYDKIHKTQEIYKYLSRPPEVLNYNNQNRHTLLPLCMPMEFVIPELPGGSYYKAAVLSYRNFYIKDKSRFARWSRNRQAPSWYTSGDIYEGLF